MELEFGGQRYPIAVGETTIGTDASCAIQLAGDGIKPRHVILQGSPDGSAAVRPAADAEVLLNGVRLGAEPSPILHGDKLQVGEHELLCVDPRRSGSTQFVSASDFAKMVGASKPSGAPKPATASTGGRLVCLTDGREYTIGDAPLVFGREAGCDIVVPGKDVSRRHAEIMATPQGYVLVDSSINGTFVNGDRVQAQRVLARADVIRVGDNEFRFYADAAPVQPASAPAAPPPPLVSAPAEAPAGARSTPPPPPPPPQARPSAAAPAGAEHRLHDTMHGASLPATPRVTPSAPVGAGAARPSASLPLASMLVRSGMLKGTRLTVRVPVVNIGRADYNDLVIPDESVSTTHAKLQRREEVWILTDLGSTNGTFVDGERLAGESPLSPGTALRFGDVSVMFDPQDDEAEVAKVAGTKVLGAMSAANVAPVGSPAPVPDVRRPAPAPAEPAPRPAPRKPQVVVASGGPRGAPKWLVPAILVLIVVVVTLVLFLR